MVYYLKWLKKLFSISNNEGITPFCHVLCLGMHSNVMLRFMQALQDLPLCSSTVLTKDEQIMGNKEQRRNIKRRKFYDGKAFSSRRGEA